MFTKMWEIHSEDRKQQTFYFKRVLVTHLAAVFKINTSNQYIKSIHQTFLRNSSIYAYINI